MNINESNAIISYIHLRILIGVLAIALPFVCILGALLIAKESIQPSISIYYFTNVRDCFVGILVGISMFLVSYKGYGKVDNVVTTITGIIGFGIVIFPCYNPDYINAKVGFFQIPIEISGYIHLMCAFLYFALLAYNSMFLFTKTYEHKKMTKNKKRRNVVYRICGSLIYISLITLLLVFIFGDGSLITEKQIMLKIESVMLVSFGISWLVKSKTILHKRGKRNRKSNLTIA
jgi:cell division protein FtsB